MINISLRNEQSFIQQGRRGLEPRCIVLYKKSSTFGFSPLFFFTVYVKRSRLNVTSKGVDHYALIRANEKEKGMK